MFPLYTTDLLRTLETEATPATSLMEQAGLAAARLAGQLAGTANQPILLLAGPGNNGGDAFVAARHLRQNGYAVQLLFTGNPVQLPADAHLAYTAWLQSGGTCQSDLAEASFSLIIDGLFGIGLSRAADARHARLIEWVNQQRCPVLSLDIPSGLMADTGVALQPTVRATDTLSFLGAKPGLYTADGPDYCGKIHICPLDCGTPALATHGTLLQEPEIAGLFQPRLRNSHKGSFGSLGILGGCSGMTGAALLAGRTALYSGSGRVYVGLMEDHLKVDTSQPELMLRPAATLKGLSLSAVVAGPGLGTSDTAKELLGQCLLAPHPLLLDADALNLLAQHETLRAQLLMRTQPLLLTPHPAEAARLLDCDTQAIQQDRLQAAQQLASRFNAHVVLKGVGSIIASPAGHWHINPSGNPGLASAGTGDVLSGLIGSLLAQGMRPGDACTAGVYVHGAAADQCVADGIGPVGLSASELLPRIRRLINQWAYRP